MERVKHIISLGAGVQSSTMALMAAAGEITPMPDASIFADTQGEPQSVYTWLEWLETQLPFPVYRVTAGNLADAVTDLRATKDGRMYSRTNIPMFTRNHDGSEGKIRFRSCTKDFKLVPIHRKLKDLVGKENLAEWKRIHKSDLKTINAYRRASALARKNKTAEPMFPLSEWESCQADPLVIQWIGISTDEAVRMKPSRIDLPWVLNRWPLIEKRQSRNDCLNWMKDREYAEPPRSACVYCPYHGNDEWRRLKKDEPEEFQKAVEFEIKLQKAKAASDSFRTTPYLHRSLVALESVDFSTAEDRGQGNLFNEECEGMCGN